MLGSECHNCSYSVVTNIGHQYFYFVVQDDRGEENEEIEDHIQEEVEEVSVQEDVKKRLKRCQWRRMA